MRSDLVAQLGVVGEAAKREVAPEVLVGELDLGAAAEIAGEQALHDVPVCGGLVEELRHAGEDLDRAAIQLGGQGGEIGGAESLEVFLGVRVADAAEDLPHDPSIGAPGEVHVLQRMLQRERIAQGDVQGAHACAAEVRRVPSMSQRRSVFTEARRFHAAENVGE